MTECKGGGGSRVRKCLLRRKEIFKYGSDTFLFEYRSKIKLNYTGLLIPFYQ